MSKNAIIVDGKIIKKNESAVLLKESEIILGGEPIIISNYEAINSPHTKEENWFDGREDLLPSTGTNLKECLFWYYKYRKLAEQRKDLMPTPPSPPQPTLYQPQQMMATQMLTQPQMMMQAQIMQAQMNYNQNMQNMQNMQTQMSQPPLFLPPQLSYY